MGGGETGDEGTDYPQHGGELDDDYTTDIHRLYHYGIIHTLALVAKPVCVFYRDPGEGET